MTNLFKVDGQTLTPIEIYPAVSGTVNYLTFAFMFSYDWAGLTKSAIFTKGTDVFEAVLTDDQVLESDRVNLSAGTWSISVVGDTVVDAVVTRQITTNSYEFTVTQSSATSGGVFPPSVASQVYINTNQETPQRFVGGIPKLAVDRVIADDNDLADKKHVADVVATVTADDFDHNDLSNKQGGAAGEYYHTTQAQNAALHAHSNKTALDAVSGTNTGDQDVSGAISTHNTDEAAHSELFGDKADLSELSSTKLKTLQYIKKSRFGAAISLPNFLSGSNLDYLVSDDVTSIKTYGKNLVNPSGFIPANAGVLITSANNVITVVNNNAYGASGYQNIFLGSGTYTISADDSFGVAVMSGSTYISGIASGLNKSATFTLATSGVYKLYFSINAGITDTIVNLMLELSSTKTTFVSYEAVTSYVPGNSIPSRYTVIVNGTFISAIYQTNDTCSIDNVLYGKTALFDGDSIMRASPAGVIGIPALLAARNGMTYINYALDGGTIAYVSGHHCISRNIPSMSKDADFVIFQGLINDMWLTVPMGAVSSGYNATLDDTTFCGAFEQMLKNAILKWMGKKIGFIITHKVYNTITATTPYVEKAREICEKWSVPYLDLFKESGLCFELTEIKNLFSNNDDGCHPNYYGYVILTDKIEAWMRTL